MLTYSNELFLVVNMALSVLRYFSTAFIVNVLSSLKTKNYLRQI